MKKLYLCLAFVFTILRITNAQEPINQLPKNAKLISQSCDQNDLYISLLDLDNDELVILRYGYKTQGIIGSTYGLKLVIRTGIKIDPKIQDCVKGSDSPFKEEEKPTQNTDTNE
ncbi:MAG: hypothetical protein JW723_01615 [Bacteroidales bacterium]|nr:hypothetical protein [Bacteroidales bacterium]